jgi:hypothetical protein
MVLRALLQPSRLLQIHCQALPADAEEGVGQEGGRANNKGLEELGRTWALKPETEQEFQLCYLQLFFLGGWGGHWEGNRQIREAQQTNHASHCFPWNLGICKDKA